MSTLQVEEREARSNARRSDPSDARRSWLRALFGK
jgi:hypothetical protein